MATYTGVQVFIRTPNINLIYTTKIVFEWTLQKQIDRTSMGEL